MNKKVLSTTLGLGIALFALSSYENGPAHGGAGNRSGSNGTGNLGCSTGGCHMSENAATFNVVTTAVDATGGAAVSQYTPGHTYIVTLTGTYTGSTAYSHLGFQASVVNGTGSGVANIGTLATNISGTYTSTNTTGSINVVEHSAPIAKTGTSYIASFKWTAPVAGSGSAYIFARMVANNDNGTPGDDTPGATSLTLTENTTTAIKEVANNNLFQLYPNPAQNKINLKLNQLTTGKYDVSITGIDGKVVMASKTNFSKDEMSIDISGFAKGMYILTLHSQDNYQITRFVKQ